MGTETGNTNNVNHHRTTLDIVMNQTGLHVDGCNEHQEVVRLSMYDIIDFKNGCLRHYQKSGIRDKEQFNHVTELLSKVLELEKNLDEVNTIVLAIAQKSASHYQSSFEYLRYQLQQYYFTLMQLSLEVSEQVNHSSHQVQDLLSA